jgi:phasin family protein
MFTFSESPISQAFKAQIDAQLSFFSLFSDKMLDGMQRMTKLNTQVAKTMVDESLAKAQQAVSANDQNGASPLSSEHTLSSAEKIRGYLQHMQNIVADTQAAISTIVEHHMPPDIGRVAEAIENELINKASEDPVKATQNQKEVFGKNAIPITQATERSAKGTSQNP